MPQLMFVELSLLSQTERRALSVPLDSQRLVIQGGNGFGKSAIVKSLYETLGATPQKIDDSWKSANVSSCLRFKLDGVAFAAVKALGVHALFDGQGELLFMGQGLVKDWGPKLADVLGFKLVMSDGYGASLTPPPSYIFAPFYIDQDAGWAKAWDSFADLYLPNSSRTLAEYHSGLKPDGYYEAKADAQKERVMLAAMEGPVTTLRETITQVQDIGAEAGPTLDLQEFEAEIADLVAESTRLHDAQATYRRAISELHEQAHILRAEKSLLEGALMEMRGEFNMAASLPDEVECPTCGHGYENRLADRFALIADEGVLTDALGKANVSLLALISRETKERAKLDGVRGPLGRIQTLLASRRASLSLSDVVVAAGKTEAAKILRGALDEKLLAVAEVEARIEALKADMERFTSKKRSGEILAGFRAKLSAYATQLDVRLENPARQSITTIKTARGSEGPRALLAYYYAFLHSRAGSASAMHYPLVIDAPNQQGQDGVHLPQMLQFIFTNAPRGSQVIVATEDVGKVALDGVDVRSFGERKHQVLREKDYDQVQAKMKPFTDAILAATGTL